MKYCRVIFSALCLNGMKFDIGWLYFRGRCAMGLRPSSLSLHELLAKAKQPHNRGFRGSHNIQQGLHVGPPICSRAFHFSI